MNNDPYNIKVEKTQVRNFLGRYSDHLDKEGHVSITEWPNGEGFDINIDCGKEGYGASGDLQITWAQWTVLAKLVKSLLKESRNEISN